LPGLLIGRGGGGEILVIGERGGSSRLSSGSLNNCHQEPRGWAADGSAIFQMVALVGLLSLKVWGNGWAGNAGGRW
jgi:hypothetical protein